MIYPTPADVNEVNKNILLFLFVSGYLREDAEFAEVLESLNLYIARAMAAELEGSDERTVN